MIESRLFCTEVYNGLSDTVYRCAWYDNKLLWLVIIGIILIYIILKYNSKGGKK